MDALTFRTRMAALPEPPQASESDLWNHWRRQLWELAQTQPPESYQEWPPIRHTMLVCHWPMDYQLAQLKAGDWPRWEQAIQATAYSCKADIHEGTTYSKDLINQCYHLLMWERCTGDRVEWLDSICEVGGGYGSLALICHRLGFRGMYSILDLPEFSLLQRWFLGQQHVPARCMTRLDRRTADLFVGIYSLSEMPMRRRRVILDSWLADSYLLIYSGDWMEYDNRAFFSAWADNLSDFRWWHWRMEQENDRPDYYRIGERWHNGVGGMV